MKRVGILVLLVACGGASATGATVEAPTIPREPSTSVADAAAPEPPVQEALSLDADAADLERALVPTRRVTCKRASDCSCDSHYHPAPASDAGRRPGDCVVACKDGFCFAAQGML